MGLVIDTSALVEVERQGTSLEGRLAALATEKAVVPAIVYAELQVGVRLAGTRARAAARRRRIEALVARVPVIEFDRAMAERWADLFAESTRTGNMVPANDLAVAATAVHLGYGVLLGPKGDAHFERIPGLTIVRL